MGMGMGTCGCQNPCGFRPWVPHKLTWQEGDNPPCHVNSCLLMQQGAFLPPCYLDSHFSTWQGGRNPCHCINLCMCVVLGRQMGEENSWRGGVRIRLHVFKLQTNLSQEWA